MGLPLIILLGAAAIAGLLWRSGRLRGTTLVAPWGWAIAAVAAVVMVEVITLLAPALDRTASLSALRYTAYAATFCPIVALLGAKRPQDRGWQMIVLSLWGIMLMPAFSAFFFSRGEFTVELIWSCFLAILIVIGFINTLATRYWLAGTLVTAAQIVVLGEVLPGLSGWFTNATFQTYLSGSDRSVIFLGLIVLAIAAIHISSRSGKKRPLGDSNNQSRRMEAMNTVWLDFRNAFGTIWGLRIAERVNANATRYDWGVVLHWSGFERASADEAEATDLSGVPDEVVNALEPSTRVLLRRFVSPEWLEERLSSSAADRVNNSDSVANPRQN